eukprot:CAMPEP_0196808140 /NCGR_PEP_ID=MMETSP1362-20130617/8124_1 /TAXON_ID=163516 /ORGANISM="Leptocylindrus danicus, Strain CCMP1856" /LENGTH=391 /DNA_ID=CAMNT_0042182355 /DNA_START=74 /DNA_END=1247 /DNA_ORIENTATION=-
MPLQSEHQRGTAAIEMPQMRSEKVTREIVQAKPAAEETDDMRERARSVLMIEHNNDTSPISIDQKSNEDIEKLRERVEEMQGKVNEVINRTNSAAVSLASATVSNDEEENAARESQNTLTVARSQLSKMQLSTLTDFADAVERTRGDVRMTRYTLALDLFQMFRLDIAQDAAARGRAKKASAISSSTRSSPSGVGKISGLPLPHAGLPLYGVLPRPIQTSALRLVASLTAELARVLVINLPHPLLLRERDTGCQLADHIVRSRDNEANPSKLMLPDMSAPAIEKRIKRATAAIILETPRSGTSSDDLIPEYVLQPPEEPLSMAKEQEEFEVGLQLLQHNIIYLCMSIGVSPGDMRAAEAVLLNLNECKKYILLKVGKNTKTKAVIDRPSCS